MNFDWYGGSVSAEPDELVAGLVGHFDQSSLRRARGRWGYEQAAEVVRGDSVLALVMWEGLGGAKEAGCFVQGTGRRAPAVADYLRGSGFEHRVARADAAEDYRGPGCFDQLSGLCLSVADKYGIKVEHAGDWHRGTAGRSIYLGGREAVTRVICYEKGKQVGGDPTHTRVELRVRPKGPGKLLATAATPLQLWGGARWSTDLAGRLTGEEVQRMSLGTVYHDADLGRAVRMLVRQYGPTLQALCDQHGSWSAVGEWLGEQCAR